MCGREINHHLKKKYKDQVFTLMSENPQKKKNYCLNAETK